MPDSVVIVSGGMDSVTLLHYLVKKENLNPAVISFLYGQKHSKEIAYARENAALLGCKDHAIVDLSSMKMIFASSALVSEAITIPEVVEVMGDPQPPTYVPNRNMIFLALAAAYAETLGVGDIYYGAQRHDIYCVSADTWVDTPSGPTLIGSLKVGDTVMSHDGFTNVTNIGASSTPVYYDFRIGAKEGNRIKCSPNHLLPMVRFTRSTNDGRTFKNHRVEWRMACEIQEGDYLCMPTAYQFTAQNDLTDLTRLRLWYTCEGSLNGNGAVVIGQSLEKNARKYQEITALIERLGWKAWKSFDRIAFTETAQHHFDDLGKNADEKRLPPEVFALSPIGIDEAMNILIDADGHRRSRDDYFYTKSLRMAQEVISLALRAGRAATLQGTRNGVYIVHLPSTHHYKARYRFEGGRYRMMEVRSAQACVEEMALVSIETESHTFIGGVNGLTLQHNGYWDTTPQFLETLNQVYTLNRKIPVRIKAPFVQYSKGDILRIGLEMDVDYGKTWSCYNGQDQACGTCPTCAERLKAFEEVGVTDPIPYAR